MCNISNSHKLAYYEQYGQLIYSAFKTLSVLAKLNYAEIDTQEEATQDRILKRLILDARIITEENKALRREVK